LREEEGSRCLWTRGLLAPTREGRGFRYRPDKSREELLAELSDELIVRLLDDFGGIALAQLGARIDGLDAVWRETASRRSGEPDERASRPQSWPC
jgi:hypothetical protein